MRSGLKGSVALRALIIIIAATWLGHAKADPPFDLKSPYTLGDWAGYRTRLAQHGVDFEFSYTSESAANLHGGYNGDDTGKYSDQWTGTVHLDMAKLARIKGGDFQFTITRRDGNDLTKDRLTDPRTGTVSSVQEVHGRGNVFRLSNLWYRQRLFDNGLVVKLGRASVGDDFATMPSNFQNLYLGGGEPGNQNGDIWRNGPVSQWSASFRVNAGPHYYGAIGFYDINPKDLDDDKALDLYHSSGSEGTLIPLEFGWLPSLGPAGLPGQYKIGGYYSTAEATDYQNDGTQKGHRLGLYYVVIQQFTKVGEDKTRGLVFQSTGAWNDRDTSFVDRYLAGMLVYNGLFDRRPKDDLGFGIAYAHVNDDYDHYMSSGNGLLLDSAPDFHPSQSVEYNLELYYGYHVADWLQFRPNLQYVINPGANSDVSNALVGGLMVKANF